MVDKFSDYELFVNKILSSKKFIELYQLWKDNNNKCNYELLADFLVRKCNKYSYLFFLTDSNNKLIFNSRLDNTYQNYINGEIIFSDKYMAQTFRDSNFNEQSNTYVEVFGKKSKTTYTYVAKKFNYSAGSGITHICKLDKNNLPTNDCIDI